MVDTPKLAWDFKQSNGLNEELRKARALEYIAHYLDRIEGHLAAIAGQAAPRESIAQIALSLKGIEQVVTHMKP